MRAVVARAPNAALLQRAIGVGALVAGDRGGGAGGEEGTPRGRVRDEVDLRLDRLAAVQRLHGGAASDVRAFQLVQRGERARLDREQLALDAVSAPGVRKEDAHPVDVAAAGIRARRLTWDDEWKRLHRPVAPERLAEVASEPLVIREAPLERAVGEVADIAPHAPSLLARHRTSNRRRRYVAGTSRSNAASCRDSGGYVRSTFPRSAGGTDCALTGRAGACRKTGRPRSPRVTVGCGPRRRCASLR